MTTAVATAPKRPPPPTKPLPPIHLVVLDWLCKQPAKVYDFADVAEALNLKRGEVENVIGDLQHQRFGALLATMTPNGMRLRRRHAYLPAKSPARTGYPPVEDVPAEAFTHPTLLATERAKKEALEAAARAVIEEQKTLFSRAEAHGMYRKRKLDAREKAKAENPPKPLPERFVTGMVTLGPPAPSPTDAPDAPSALIEPPPESPPATYKKKDRSK